MGNGDLWKDWFVFLCFLLLPAGSVVGFIISTELTIKANAGLVCSRENQWSLAQTLAVFLVLPNTYMVLKCAWVVAKGICKQGSRGTSSGMGKGDVEMGPWLMGSIWGTSLDTREEGHGVGMSQHSTRGTSSGTGDEGHGDGIPQHSARGTSPGTGEDGCGDGISQ